MKMGVRVGVVARLNADKRVRETSLLFQLVRKELTHGGWVQTLGSMVTECVINAVVCPVPRTYQPRDPFSDSSREGEVSRGRGGHPDPPLCHCICPERESSLHWGLRRMTHVSHEVMGDNKLVSNDRCVEGRGHLRVLSFTLDFF